MGRFARPPRPDRVLSDLSAADIAARAIAWHNRHPLARRLGAADVHSVGHVALPYLDSSSPAPAARASAAPAAASGSLRERAMARARDATADGSDATLPVARPASGAGSAATAAFRDDFIPPLAPAEVAAFGAAHGISRLREPAGAPVRRVPPQPAGAPVAWRWVLTAELRAGGARTRLLLGPAPGGAVLGRRLWSLPRVGVLAAAGGAALALAVAAGVLPGWPQDEAVPGVAVLPAPAAPTTSAPAPAAPASVVATPVPAPASAAPPEAAASRPADVEPRLGQIELPALPPLAEARRRAAAASAAGAAAQPGTATAAPSNPALTPAFAPAFALATRPLRTRTESQQTAEALRALLVVPGSPVQRVDVMPMGDDFRVVGWPYPSRAAAEAALAALAARGHRVEVIEF